MSTIVITGSTKGIGRGLAEAFAARGNNVVISGQNASEVEAAVGTIAGKTGRAADRVLEGGDHGRSIAWLTGGKIMQRLMVAKLLGKKRTVVPEAI